MWHLIFSFFFTLPAYAKKINKISIKNELLKIHQDHRFTFFCQQPFSIQGKATFKACEKCPIIFMSIQWMPIVPYTRLANEMLCYKEKICIDASGKRFKGLRCCRQTNPFYQKMEADLFNYVPEMPALKNLRGNLSFATVSHNEKQTAECDLYIDKKEKIIEPPAITRGLIARTYLYMRDTYRLHLSEDEINQYLQWHHSYPISDWERERNQRIRVLQGMA